MGGLKDYPLASQSNPCILLVEVVPDCESATLISPTSDLFSYAFINTQQEVELLNLFSYDLIDDYPTNGVGYCGPLEISLTLSTTGSNSPPVSLDPLTYQLTFAPTVVGTWQYDLTFSLSSHPLMTWSASYNFEVNVLDQCIVQRFCAGDDCNVDQTPLTIAKDYFVGLNTTSEFSFEFNAFIVEPDTSNCQQEFV